MRCPLRLDRNHRNCPVCDLDAAEYHAQRRLLVRECAVCGESPTYVEDALYDPALTVELAPGVRSHEPPTLYGWRTTCGCTVEADTWILAVPGPGVVPRWVRRETW